MDRNQRGPYKQYLMPGSSVPVPKRTLRYWRSKRRRLSTSESDS